VEVILGINGPGDYGEDFLHVSGGFEDQSSNREGRFI